ncbi:MAG: C-GCAxxG-C-C family protein [Christensenellales bacterium]
MSKEKMSPETALKMFGQGFDCSQVVLSSVSDKLGISRETALKAAAAFGGGMWHGETCGCVVGALMAIGLKYGTSVPGDAETKNDMLKKKAEFEEKFCAAHKSYLCREILGYNLAVPEEMAQIQEKKLLETVCPGLVCKTCEILENIL